MPQGQSLWAEIVSGPPLESLPLMVSVLALSSHVAAKSLESIAPYVAGRWENDLYLFRGAGL